MKTIKKKQLKKDIRTVLILSIAALILYQILVPYLSPNMLWLYRNIAKYGMFALIARYAIQHSAYSFKKIMGSFSLKNVNWLELSGLNVLLAGLNLPMAATIMQVGNVSSNQVLKQTLRQPLEGLDYVPSLILSVVVAPIVEEVLFRGYLLNRLGKKNSSRLALVLSAAVFSLIQSQGVVIPQFVTGLFFGMAYMKTRKLIVPIVLNAMKKATDTFITYVVGQELVPYATTNLNRYAFALEQYLSEQTILFFIVAPLCGYWLYRFSQKLPKQVPLLNKLKF